MEIEVVNVNQIIFDSMLGSVCHVLSVDSVLCTTDIVII